LGEEICTLINEKQAAGEKSLVWDGTNRRKEAVSSGMYICNLQADDITITRKMILTK
jgi:flagellar hook assembly protein FlgD